jgi:hypothetical protein
MVKRARNISLQYLDISFCVCLALFSTRFHAAFFLAYIWTLKKEPTYFSETSVNFNELHGVILPKTALFIFQFVSSFRDFRLNFVRIYHLPHTCYMCFPSFLHPDYVWWRIHHVLVSWDVWIFSVLETPTKHCNEYRHPWKRQAFYFNMHFSSSPC